MNNRTCPGAAQSLNVQAVEADPGGALRGEGAELQSDRRSGTWQWMPPASDSCGPPKAETGSLDGDTRESTMQGRQCY